MTDKTNVPAEKPAPLDNLFVTYGPTIVRNVIKLGGAALTAHGMATAGGFVGSEQFIGAGLVLAGMAWSFWRDYGRVIVKHQLDVWKAQAMSPVNLRGPKA